TEHGHGPALPQPVTERVGEERRLGEGADEHQVELGGQLLEEILDPGVADELDLVPGPFAPRREHLRHDAGEVRVHEPPVQRRPGALGDEVEDADAKPSHGRPPGWGAGRESLTYHSESRLVRTPRLSPHPAPRSPLTAHRSPLT